MTIRLSVDIGGTFTDVVLSEQGKLTTSKVLTTYSDPAQGVMQGIESVLQGAGVGPTQVQTVLHGTTLATNALIERRGAPTALLTTAGHRDALEMAFENRFEQYDVNIDRPTPLVGRHWRIGINERIAADGEVLRPLDRAQVTETLEMLVAQGVESVAIGFLHSYINAAHEQRVAEISRADFPNLSITLSSEVCPEIREYERLSTTTANAYVKPLMAGYLGSLQQQLNNRGIGCPVLLMTSGGGLTTLKAAADYPIRLVESGPAGGAILAARLASEHQLPEVVSFDMGGTTAKICLIDNAQPQHSRAFEVDRSYRFKKGSGLPVRIPVIEMVEIGAGGGSVATIDALRRLQVGPESAASEPGPACYGRGGQQATVTDADVVLGKISPAFFAGGKLHLDKPRAEQVVTERVAHPLQMDLHEGAHAIAEIVQENMASATRAHASEWGKELSGRAMIAFGGAAPLHAAYLARKLKVNRVLIPAGAGVGSALGFLMAPISFEVVRSYYTRLSQINSERVEQLFVDMRDEARAVLHQAADGQVPSERRVAYMRYVGQGYEVAVELSSTLVLNEVYLREAFEMAYAQIYGRTIPDMAVEILSWTLSLSTEQHADSPQLSVTPEASPPPETVDLYEAGEPISAEIVRRETLQPGGQHVGPLLVVEDQTTTIVPADFVMTVLADGTLALDRHGRAA